MDHFDIDDGYEPEAKPKKIPKRPKAYSHENNDDLEKPKKFTKRSHRKNPPKEFLWDDLIPQGSTKKNRHR